MPGANLSPAPSDAGYKAAKFVNLLPPTLALGGPLLSLAHVLCSRRVEGFR